MCECSIVLDALHHIMKCQAPSLLYIKNLLEDNVRIIQNLTPYAGNKHVETLLTPSVLRLLLLTKSWHLIKQKAEGTDRQEKMKESCGSLSTQGTGIPFISLRHLNLNSKSKVFFTVKHKKPGHLDRDYVSNYFNNFNSCAVCVTLHESPYFVRKQT